MILIESKVRTPPSKSAASLPQSHLPFPKLKRKWYYRAQWAVFALPASFTEVSVMDGLLPLPTPLPKLAADAGGPLLFLVFGLAWGLLFWVVAALVEALTMYVALRPSLLRAFGLSLLANFISSIVGLWISLYVFFVLVGPSTSEEAMIGLGMGWISMGLVSIGIEVPVWVWGLRNLPRPITRKRIAGFCALANVLGYVVIGLLIWLGAGLLT